MSAEELDEIVQRFERIGWMRPGNAYIHKIPDRHYSTVTRPSGLCADHGCRAVYVMNEASGCAWGDRCTEEDELPDGRVGHYCDQVLLGKTSGTHAKGDYFGSNAQVQS